MKRTLTKGNEETNLIYTAIYLFFAECTAISLQLEPVPCRSLLDLDHQRVINQHEDLALGRDDSAHVVDGSTGRHRIEQLVAEEQLGRVYLAVTA